MPANKHALIRYKTIDRCLRNRYRKWTLEDLIEACSKALKEAEGISKGISMRTVQGDIQMMRSNKLGYNAPIEVYDLKYYRYADDKYSIMNMPLSANDYEVMQEAVDMLRQLSDFNQLTEIVDVINRLQDKLSTTRNKCKPLIHLDSISELKGLQFLSPLYKYIFQKQTLHILCKSFSSDEELEYTLYPYLLKEFDCQWFLFGSLINNLRLQCLPLNRIISIEPINKPFMENPDFDTEHFFDDIIGISKSIGNTPQEIIFWANKEQSKYIKSKPIHPSQELISEDTKDGGCIFSIKVVINIEMYSVFMSFGPGLVVTSPNHVARYMQDKLGLAATQYNKGA